MHFINKPSLLTHEELVRRCQAGDRKAQKQLFDLFASPLFRVAQRYVQREADAKDVLIMAFTKVYANLATFSDRGPGSLEAWMRKVVVNESLMWIRRRHNFTMTEALQADDDQTIDLDAVSQLPAEDIVQLIQELPHGYRTVFNLYVVEGYSHQEIAAMLGITESTSRTQLYKAKAILRKNLTLEGFHYGT